jgi:hypothetical protein
MLRNYGKWQLLDVQADSSNFGTGTTQKQMSTP